MNRRERLSRARLYLCTPISDGLDTFLKSVLDGGVDIVQLRDKDATAYEQVRAAEVFRSACDGAHALFVMNDRADLVLATGADGVHLGQDDLPPGDARALLGPDLLIGRSTHSPSDLARALHEPVDYLGVGPVNATPTKPGRAGVGLPYVEHAAAEATVPFFVTGGMNASTIPAVVTAGARGVVVVRALTEADDPGAVARALRTMLPE